jgi:hypothetical protein
MQIEFPPENQIFPGDLLRIRNSDPVWTVDNKNLYAVNDEDIFKYLEKICIIHYPVDTVMFVLQNKIFPHHISSQVLYDGKIIWVATHHFYEGKYILSETFSKI